MVYRRAQKNIKGKILLVSRIVMSEHLGRKLESWELVHHIDHNPFNNDISNLQLTTRSEHKKLHSEIGMSTRLKKIWHLDDREILEMFKCDTIGQIANKIGCSYKTIERIIKKYSKHIKFSKLNKRNNEKSEVLTQIIKEMNYEK